MAEAIIVGDGPAGLSAALFLAKNGITTTVYGQDETPMHAAMLYNYLGIEAMTGSDFQKLARKQVIAQGATIKDEKVTGAEQTKLGFAVTTESGDRREAKYLVLATGATHDLAVALGLEKKKNTVESDRNGRTGVPRLYVTGWTTRPDKIQAIISAGDGAATALDILSAEAGKDIHDFDVVDEK